MYLCMHCRVSEYNYKTMVFTDTRTTIHSFGTRIHLYTAFMTRSHLEMVKWIWMWFMMVCTRRIQMHGCLLLGL